MRDDVEINYITRHVTSAAPDRLIFGRPTLGGKQMMETPSANRELIAFKVVMWSIAIASLVAIARRALALNPTTLPLHYLFISAAGAAALLIILPNLLTRVRALNVAGVKLTLGQLEHQETLLEDIKVETTDPSAVITEISGSGALDLPELQMPFSAKRLTGARLYHYERLSHRFYRIRDQVKDPSKLDPDMKSRYKDLITYVAKAAFAMGHYTKYVDVAKQLLKLGDERTFNDDYLIGHAYLWARTEREERTQEYLGHASEFLTRAVIKNPNDVKSQFNLGMCLFYQGGRREGIRRMYRSVGLDDSLSPWAYWNIAFALKEMKRFKLSIRMLEKIEAGPIWKVIEQDSWLELPITDEFRQKFEELRRDRVPAA